jgi:hypothetical protein
MGLFMVKRAPWSEKVSPVLRSRTVSVSLNIVMVLLPPKLQATNGQCITTCKDTLRMVEGPSASMATRFGTAGLGEEHW